jgi:diguanylate cyclase (GGDEF)-like protein
MVDKTTANTHNPKILVVDDDPAVHKLLATYFKRTQFEMESCEDSRNAISHILSFQPDLVLIDLMMPNLDGISATKRIRNLNLSSYLPVIMLTAKADNRDIIAALDAGVDDYITKPFEFDVLMARIKNMLRLKKLQDRLMEKTQALNQANEQISRLNHVLVETNRQLQKKIYDLRSIFEVSYKVMGQLEFEHLVKDALINLLGIFTAKTAMLLLVDQENPDHFKIIDVKGVHSKNIYEFTLNRNDKIVHYMDLVKRAFQIRNVAPEFADIVPRLKHFEIEVLSPLYQNEELIGLIGLGANFKDEEYTQDQLDTLGILSNMLAVAISNATMYENIRQMSYTDAMTGLHNYRYFELRLKEEIARARREGTHISLLILDVDYFKNYNDTLGHPAGDEVLRKVGKILQSSVRDNDIVARYGGEEFAIILSGAEKNGAVKLAERIREKVEEAAFYKEEIQPNNKLTISLGVATFPDDALNEVELVHNADKALYQAKNAGRNKVVAYTEELNEI